MTGLDGEGFATHAVRLGEVRLAAWSLGPADGPVLLVCHGGALDHASFRPFARAWAERYRVILWDLPGHGQSEGLREPFTAAACARALGAVMDALEARDAVTLGFSFGGVVAQMAARARPELVRRFIAYGCLSPHLGAPIIPPALAPALVKSLFGLRSWAAIRQRFGALCCVTEDGRRRVEQDMAPVGKAGFLAMARANLTASDRGGDFRIPGGVDLLAGALDSNAEAIRRTFRAFEAAYPAARRIMIDGAGHCAHLDRPDAFADAMSRLLD